MNLDEMLGLVGRGELELWFQRVPHLDDLKKAKTLSDLGVQPTAKIAPQLHIKHLAEAGKERTFEVIECVKNHATDVYVLLELSNTRVCMSPSQHWQSYRKVEADGENYYCCDLCADIRDQMIEGFTVMPAAPTTPGTILDFQERKKARETRKNDS